MFKDNFVLIGLDLLSKRQIEAWFAADGQQVVYVRRPLDINPSLHNDHDVTYVINLSHVSQPVSEVLSKISEFIGTYGVCFVVQTDKTPPKLLRKLKFKTLEMRWD